MLAIRVPTYDRLIEIESSSRLYTENNHVFLSIPLVVRSPEGMPHTTPIGFVLSRDVLLTLHFETLRVFDPLSIRHVNANGESRTASVIS